MGFSLNHAFVFIIVMFSVFGLLYVGINTEFFANQTDFDEITYQEALELREQFSVQDLILYSQYGYDNMTKGYSSIDDGPSPPNWNTSTPNRYLEVWWDDYYIPDVGTLGLYLQIRDTEQREILGVPYYVMLEICPLYINDEYIGGIGISRDNILDYAEETSITVIARGENLKSNIIITANDTMTLLESWDAEALNYVINFEIDFDAMKPDAWSLVTQLVTFQAIDLGMPEEANSIFSYIMGVAVWSCIALIIFALITSVIPTISGWRGD